MLARASPTAGLGRRFRPHASLPFNCSSASPCGKTARSLRRSARCSGIRRPPSAGPRSIALGPAPELVSDDELLPLLHDPDEDVQNLCELALRSRGLQENHIVLARLISDTRPTARLQVLQHLRDATDLEPGVWLRRLCQGPEPAVRAAGIRAASAQSEVDLRSCLQEMAEQDPSPTVKQLAQIYLARPRPTSAEY